MSDEEAPKIDEVPHRPQFRIRFPIEVPFALSVFALIFAESITTNWMMYRTCYVTLGYNESECALLGSGNSSNSTIALEKIVQPTVTVINLVKSITQVVAAVICFFIGPWSDKFGRRPVLLISFMSYALSFAIMAVISALPNVSPWYVLLCSIPTGLTGGFIAQMTIVICYITDITTISNRGMRMSIFEMASTAGSLIGTLSSSFALSVYGYTIMFAVATFCYLLCTGITLLFVPESVRNIETAGKLRSFFQISLFKKSLNATFRPRNDYNRAVLLMLIGILLTYVLAFSEFNFTFLYLRRTFNWSLQQFTIFNAGTTVTAIVGSLVVVYILHKLLKINESYMILLGLLSACNSALIVALATNNWFIYASGAIKFLSGIVSPMGRSLISKVAMEDAGAVFGFVAVCETSITLIGRTIYTYIYNTMFAAALYYFTAAIYFAAIFISIALIFIQRHKSPTADYSIMENEVS